MLNTSIECFLLAVRKKYSKDRLPLDSFDGKGANLLAVLEGVLQPLAAANHNRASGHSARVPLLKRTPLDISGTMEMGMYGRANAVVDTQTGKKAYDKGKEHADMAPFYFRAAFPKGATVGVLGLQRLGKDGIKGVLTSLLVEHFANKYSAYRLDILPLVPDYVFAAYLKGGKVRGITFRKFSIPADLANVVGGTPKEREGAVEMSITAGDGSFFRGGQLANALKAKAGVGAVYAMNQFTPFEPDEIVMKIDIGGGKTRAVNLNDWSKLKAAFDVSADVSEDLDGYPKRAEVVSAAARVMRDLGAAAGVAI